MKTFSKAEGGQRKAEIRERGMATVLFIALLAIMLILVTAESRSLWQLHREVKLLEQKQIMRLNAPATNPVVTATTGSK